MRLTETTSNRVVFILALLGAAISLYLTMAHLNYLALACGEIPGCDVVAAHPSARGLGIRGLEYLPTALLGLLMYLTVAALSFVRVTIAGSPTARWAANAQLAIVLFAVAVFAYLTYLEAYVIRAWCQWCVSASIVTVLMLVALALSRPCTEDQQNPHVQGETDAV